MNKNEIEEMRFDDVMHALLMVLLTVTLTVLFKLFGVKGETVFVVGAIATLFTIRLAIAYWLYKRQVKARRVD